VNDTEKRFCICTSLWNYFEKRLCKDDEMIECINWCIERDTSETKEKQKDERERERKKHEMDRNQRECCGVYMEVT